MKRKVTIGQAGSALALALLVVIFTSCAKTERVWPAVVLVHGIWDSAATFDRMAEALEKAGWKTYAVSLKPNDGSVSLSTLAEELRKFIDKRLGMRRRFDIVAFSMGGLVARSYVQRLGGIWRVDHFVTISTPHHGTKAAYLENLPGVLEMRPESAFLRDLNRDADRMSMISFTSIWSPLDAMINPAESSRLPFGRDVEIPVMVHPWMLTDQRVFDAVVAALSVKR